MLKEKTEIVKKDYQFIKDILGTFSLIFGISLFIIALSFCFITIPIIYTISSCVMGSLLLAIGIVYCSKRYNW